MVLTFMPKLTIKRAVSLRHSLLDHIGLHVMTCIYHGLACLADFL